MIFTSCGQSHVPLPPVIYSPDLPDDRMIAICLMTCSCLPQLHYAVECGVHCVVLHVNIHHKPSLPECLWSPSYNSVNTLQSPNTMQACASTAHTFCDVSKVNFLAHFQVQHKSSLLVCLQLTASVVCHSQMRYGICMRTTSEACWCTCSPQV